MSGKIMQKSLVLGALMAFVITGNVWAATVENNATASHAIAIGENTVSNGICSIAVGFEAKTNDALYLPFSKEMMVCLVTSTASANSF